MTALAVPFRRLRKSPTFVLFSVVTLALGIGVTTAAYSAIHVLFARSMGIEQTDRVVFLTRSNAMTRDFPTGVSWADYRDLEARQRSFTAIAASGGFDTALSNRESSQFVTVEAVTGTYFGVLGVGAALGRPIQPADDRPDAPLVVVLTDTAWRTQFKADPAIVGTTVRMANQTLEVIGVAPEGFRGARGTGVSRLAAWVPLTTASRLERTLALDSSSRRGSLTVIGRLKSAATVEAAGVDVGTVGAQLDETAPLPMTRQSPTSAPIRAQRAWKATSVEAVLNNFGSGEAIRLVMVLPALVLLVACTNLANLVLSRGVSRRHEFAVRAALGASRARLVREELVETTSIAIAGGALGLVVTNALLGWTLAVLREPIAALAPELILNWRFDPAAFAAAGVAVALTLVVAGLLPALQLTRPNPGRTLAADSGGALPRWRGRSNLIALQVGVSVGLFLITLVSVRFIVQPPNSRFAPQANLTGLAVANVPFDRQQYTTSRARRVIDVVLDELRRSPEIELAAAATELPISVPGLSSSFGSHRWVVQPGRACPVMNGDLDANKIGVSPSFFDAFGIPRQFGRSFEDRDRVGAESVVILNESLARAVFGQPNATGRTVVLCRDARYSLSPGVIETATVIGIVGDGELDRRGKAAPRAYAPLSQHDEATVTFIARGRHADPRATVGLLTSTIRRADPELAIRVAGRADVMARGPFAFLGFLATAAGGMATLAMVLAMAGLYGVLSHVVDKRRREMGVRVALGATHARIVKLVLKDGLRPVLEGTFIGLGAALVIRQLLQLSFTETLSPIDVATFLLAAVPLLVAGVIAAYLPARRAARVNPNIALKDL
jgi:predicted permease